MSTIHWARGTTLTLLIGAVTVLGCSSSSGGGSGVVAGPLDDHCTMNDAVIKTPVGLCMMTGNGTRGSDAATAALADDAGAGEAAVSDAGGSDAAGTDDAGGGGGGPDYGATLYNAEGDDDDCKYHVKWSATGVKNNGDATFKLNVMRRLDGTPATGGAVYVEVFLGDSHISPSIDTATTESAGGNYTIGPVRFDQSGKWTVRFHLYGMCIDSADSPHGHAAFYVNVP